MALYSTKKCKCDEIFIPFDSKGNRVVAETCLGCGQVQIMFQINPKTNRTRYADVVESSNKTWRENAVNN